VTSDTQATPDKLVRQLRDARARTLALSADLTGAQLLGPRMRILNPPLWEIGHLGWFQERWCLRYAGDSVPLAPSMLPHADRLYDSSEVAHDTRWDLPLPGLEDTLVYLSTVLERVIGHLSERVESKAAHDIAYFAQLCALHEEMHCEAFSYTRQTLAYAAPPSAKARYRAAAPERAARDVAIAGGEFLMGASSGGGFVFDNEKWAHSAMVAPFRMARTCVTNSEFAAFVEDQGYRRRELWTPEAWAWREAHAADHPVYWRKYAGRWYERRYDAWQPLAGDVAIVHVNWYEAGAYCRWAGRRLPSEAEWEYAAAVAPDGRKRRFPWGDEEANGARANLYPNSDGPVDVEAYPAGDSAWGCRQMIGNVWEWTADAFQPYPGFVADPYKEYSQPWFGNHKVLRGGCFATRATLIHNTWRNFYTPDRRDVYAGFRTGA
jgi:iron(II)-dependent oxidoreductase